MATASASARASSSATVSALGSIVLPPLPWAENALEPVVSAKTISFHYGKHHKTYTDTVSKMIAGTEFADMTLETLISATAGKADKAGIFNNAAQVWNHTFYWNSLRPKGGGEPPSMLQQKIEAAFGSVDACQKELSAAAGARFGVRSGQLSRDHSHVQEFRRERRLLRQ